VTLSTQELICLEPSGSDVPSGDGSGRFVLCSRGQTLAHGHVTHARATPGGRDADQGADRAAPDANPDAPGDGGGGMMPDDSPQKGLACLPLQTPVLRTEAAEVDKVPIADLLAQYPPFSEAAAQYAAARSGEAAPLACLEVASGTGQHIAHFARQFAHVTFQPTEHAGTGTGGAWDAFAASIVAHNVGLTNVRMPEQLDVSSHAWTHMIEATRYDAIVALNLCHIAPYKATEGLIAGAARLLNAGGILAIYGPFVVDGVPVAPGATMAEEARRALTDLDFQLRSHDGGSRLGVRSASEIVELAMEHGMRFVKCELIREASPNHLLLFMHGFGDELLSGAVERDKHCV